MNDRFKFRATFSVSYYDENGNDKDIKLTIYDVAVYSGGEIGFSAQQMETIIDALKLPEIEKDSIWQFINDNYATSCYEWFVCNNAIVEQCTGLSDKNGKLIYEGDIIIDRGEIKYQIMWKDARFVAVAIKEFDYMPDTLLNQKWLDALKIEIIGNIHENKGE